LQEAPKTLEQYLQICEEMGVEPKEGEIPVNPTLDFSPEAQQAFYLYHILPDIVDGMTGTWYGKNFSGIGDLLNIYSVENKKDVFDYLVYMIQIARDAYAKEREIQSKTKAKR